MKRLFRFLAPAMLGLLVFAAAWPAAVAASDDETSGVPTVELFTPEGTVKKVRQVAARFSDAMVPFGDPRLPDPFVAESPVKGKGRWADERNWVFDFDEDLPAGIACRFTLAPGLKTLAGTPVGGERVFSFSTGGPAIVRSIPYEGSHELDEAQAFILLLDAVADEASILANVSFSVEGIEQQIGALLVKGKDRETLLTLGPARGMIRLPDNARGESSVLEFRRKKDFDDPRIVILQARQRFPAGAEVVLSWGAGVKAAGGVATTEAQELTFRTREPFRVKFSCDREGPDMPCIPMLPMTLSFSSPVPRKLAAKIALQGASGRKYLPEVAGSDEGDAGDNLAYYLAFKGPFPADARFTVRLPDDFRDDAGRIPENLDRFPLPVATGGYPPLAKFAAPFGILEWTGEALLPVTLRNLEAMAKARLADIGEAEPAESEPGESPGAGARKIRRAPRRIRPGASNPAPSAEDWQTAERNRATEDLKGRIRPVVPGKDAEILAWLRKVERAYRYHAAPIQVSESLLSTEKEAREIVLPRPAGDNAFQVVGIPLPRPGFYIVEVESGRLGESLLGKEPMVVPTAALVTNLSAHFKKGRESSAVWVTALDSGNPVPGAKVVVHDANGKALWEGETGEDGVALIRAALPGAGVVDACGSYCGYFVTARKGEDMTFVLSSWQQGIESWRYNLADGDGHDPSIAHTVFDRTLFRAGETVSMKHFMRRHYSGGLTGADPKRLPKGIAIVHHGSDQRYHLPLSWDANGSAEGHWAIPKEAKLGEYSVYLLDADLSGKEHKTTTGRYREGDEEFWRTPQRLTGGFRVEEYRVPLMRASVRPVAAPLVRPASASLDLLVSYLSGGGAGNAPVTLRTAVRPASASFPGYEEYVFANGAVKEGVVRAASRYEAFEDDEGGEPALRSLKKPAMRTRKLQLDASGALRTTVDRLPPVSRPADLVAELEYADPNGEIQTVSARVPLYPAKRLPGILPDSWAASKEAFRFKVAVLDLHGKPVPDAPVSVDLFRKVGYSHRKRLIGGFYAYEYVSETKKVAADFCAGKTDAKGLLFCESASPLSGNLILQARVADGDGAVAAANRDVWIAGKDDWWFEQQDGDRIDLIPERKRYEPGETARFQVRMPFREATALVAVEREGVLETFVRKLSGKSPVVEIPVRTGFAPNVYVSALVVRGRVADVAPTATVDLGRPAYRLGNASIAVGWKAHELLVTVATDKPAYGVRERAKVKVKVARADGGALPAGSEVAVSAVDEGLLELSANGSWELLRAMMGERPHEVATATAQTQVVGRRHFGLKALPSGGGGGRQSVRKLFDTLLLWKPRLLLDEQGEASFDLPLNDSLTAFRIVGIASGGDALFGTGHASIRTTQPLMLLPGLPQLVREGDRFRASVTVRNGSDRPIDATVSAAVAAGGRPAGQPLAPRKMTLAPGAARDATWEFTVPFGDNALSWRLEAAAADNSASDRVEVRQAVAPAVPVRTYQATIRQVDAPFTTEVAMPADALPGRGGMEVDLKPRLSEGLGAVRHFMAGYPYSCLEQRVSVAVALRDPALWQAIVSDLPSSLDHDGLAKYFPRMLLGDDALTAYLVSIADEAGWKIPEPVEKRMLDALEGFIEGRVVRGGALRTADLSIRKMAALEALSRRGRGRAGLLGPITVTPNLWPTSAVLDWTNVLLRVPGIPDKAKRLTETESVLRSRLNFQGTTMGFSTERTDYLWWLMVSGDVNAVKGLMTFLKLPRFAPDIARIANGAIARQQKGAWSTTVANAWGVLAMERFSAKYESVPVKGNSRAALGGRTERVDWAARPKGGRMNFPWPKGKQPLSVSHEGTGAPWATLLSRAAIPLKQPLSSGYRIAKTLAPVSRKTKGKWSRGDVVRVTLDLEAQADMTWVVVDDPVPAGASILGTGLGRDSALLTEGEHREGLAWPAFEERAFEGYRAFYSFVPKGKWRVSYTMRLNNGGRFQLPPTRVEAMYAPEMFGESPNPAMTLLP